MYVPSSTQDGPTPSEGTIISELGSDGWIRVRWDTGLINSYRMEEKCDLTLAASEVKPTPKEGDMKDVPSDVDLKVGMARGMDAADAPTSLILQAGVCLLQSLVVGVGVHAGQLHPRTTSSVVALMHHIVQCGQRKGKYGCDTSDTKQTLL